MKTAAKLKNRAAKAARTTAARRCSESTTEILLAARWVAADEDDRLALKAISRALPQAGITARLWRPFEDSLADCRCLHFFGTAAEFLPVVESAQRNGVKVVLSPESWQNADCGPYPRGWLQKTAGLVQIGRETSSHGESGARNRGFRRKIQFQIVQSRDFQPVRRSPAAHPIGKARLYCKRPVDRPPETSAFLHRFFVRSGSNGKPRKDRNRAYGLAKRWSYYWD